VVSDVGVEVVVLAVLARLLTPEHERLDVIVGEGAPPREKVRAAIEAAHPGLEVDVHEGGLLRYPLLLVAE
jgi:hypothetical protein